METAFSSLYFHSAEVLHSLPVLQIQSNGEPMVSFLTPRTKGFQDQFTPLAASTLSRGLPAPHQRYLCDLTVMRISWCALLSGGPWN